MNPARFYATSDADDYSAGGRTLKNELLLFCGPIAVGGTYLIERMIERHPARFVEVRSTTTRAPRPGQQNDQTRYRFVSKEEFNALVAKKQLAEWDTYWGEFYGTEMNNLADALARGNALMKITLAGARAIVAAKKGQYPVCVTFLIPADPTVIIRILNRRYKKQAPGNEYKRELELMRQILYEMEGAAAENILVPDFTLAMNGTGESADVFEAFLRSRGTL